MAAVKKRKLLKKWTYPEKYLMFLKNSFFLFCQVIRFSQWQQKIFKWQFYCIFNFFFQLTLQYEQWQHSWITKYQVKKLSSLLTIANDLNLKRVTSLCSKFSKICKKLYTYTQYQNLFPRRKNNKKMIWCLKK